MSHFLRHYRNRFLASRRRDGLRNKGHEQRVADGIRTVPVYHAQGLPLQFVEGFPAADPAQEKLTRGPVVARDESAHRPGNETDVWRGIRTGRAQEDRVGPKRGHIVCGRHKHPSTVDAFR